MVNRTVLRLGHPRSPYRGYDRRECHSTSPAHEDHERRLAGDGALPSSSWLVALRLPRTSDGHGCAEDGRTAAAVEEHLSLGDALRQWLCHWRCHWGTDRLHYQVDVVRSADRYRIHRGIHA